MLTKAATYINDLKDQAENGERVIDMHNPLCHNCNECCAMTTVLSPKEREELLKYFETPEGKTILKVARNKVKRYWRKGTAYMMCPFTNDDTKKCMIYNRRPIICKKYHCGEATYKEYFAFKQKYFEELDLEREENYTMFDFFEDIFQS